MNKSRRIPALFLAMLMLGSLCLTGCQKEEAPAPADQVAVALFQMILKDDASAAVELFGYADEAAARKDMGLEDSIYDELAEQVVAQLGAGTKEDAQTFVDAFLSMFKNVNMTAKVKESDDKAGTAVVTCTVNTFDPDALTDAMAQVVVDIMADEELLSGDEDALYSAIMNKMSGAIAGLTPTENTADFDVDFELSKVEINGSEKKVWLPKDTEKFGELISTTAMGG